MVNIRMQSPTNPAPNALETSAPTQQAAEPAQTSAPAPVQNMGDGLSPKIFVIGVGGAGGNAVNNIKMSEADGLTSLAMNTDAQALGNSLADDMIQLGVNVTGGLGAGSKPEIGKAAAEESLDEIMSKLEGANMVFVTAGMGGGTGTGAAPIIAKACREKGILTVGVVTKPFHFEGSHRMKLAEEGLKEMEGCVDTLIVIPNQNLFRVADERTTFAEAFQMADSVLQSGVVGVTDLMVRPGLVNLDFADIRTAMLEMGKAMMGTGEAEGEKRAIEAAEAAINNPLLDDVSMKGARGVIINVTGGYDMTLFEADEACNRVRDEVDPEANIIFGATFDDKMNGKMRVSIVATGIDRMASSGTGSFTNSGTSGGFGGAKPLERAMPNAESAATETQEAELTAPPGAPETEMMDQNRYSAPEAASEAPHNTALRGTRYKDAFIPPAPMQGMQEMTEEASAPIMSAPVTSQPLSAPPKMVSQTVASTPVTAKPVGSSLQLNPPKMPTPTERKKTPSIFERISGSVKNTIDGFIEEARQAENMELGEAPTQGEQPKQQAPQTIRPSLGGPAQGSLNMDAPAAPAKDTQGELDIPAFLRRQAN